MKVAIGSDHRGFEVKGLIVALLQQLGHEAIDIGPYGKASADYPDYAFWVAQAVAEGEAQRGILVCGTGIGMCIVANKVLGVRAAPCHDTVTAETSRRHHDANVLCLSAELLGEELIGRMVKIWLETDFEGGRHARRLDKILCYEAQRPGSIMVGSQRPVRGQPASPALSRTTPASQGLWEVG